MNRKSSIYLVLIGIALLTCIALCVKRYHHLVTFKMSPSVEVKGSYDTPNVKFTGNHGAVFNDWQSTQIRAAQRFGVVPMASKSEIDERRLVKISACKYYNCLADIPYLTPNAADLLAEIGRRYQSIEGKRKHLRVTSALRTKEHVKSLRTNNSNAVNNSCHLYGTTFDISYKYMSAKEKHSLAQALFELQQGGYCYVKHEVNQPCFHITCRR